MSEILGKIIHIGEVETVGNNGFTKRLLVVETSEQYAQKIPVDFVQDKTNLLNNYVLGDSVKVDINLRGSQYNNKWYCNLQGWRITKTEQVNNSAVENYQAKAEPEDDGSGLPF